MNRGKLLRWYRRHRRDLPWRRTSDPYAIWVSEVMLQQTRVTVVVPYYEQFLARFPDVRSLARSGEDEVLSLWSGLGYYRRARALREGARAIVERHGGRIPRDVAALRALPGIGRYTAGAIASMAFGSEEPVLDGNVRRVFARLLAIRNPRDAALWKLAQDLVRGRSPGDWNQALMELGATRCTPEKPRCGSCPLKTDCAGCATGRPEAYPAPPPRREVRRIRVAVALVRAHGRILLERPGAESPLRGTWDLPAIEIATDDDARQALATRWGAHRRLALHVGREETRARHAILDRRLTIEAYACRIARGKADGTRLRWLGVEEISAVPVSGATKKILRQLRERDIVAETGSSQGTSSPSARSRTGAISASSARSSR